MRAVKAVGAVLVLPVHGGGDVLRDGPFLDLLVVVDGHEF